MNKKVIRFLRVTFQGVSIATFGTVSFHPEWVGFISGLTCGFLAFALYMYEE